jgi:UDP-N-acetyl-D-glucosamine dehydrogenase
MPDHVVARVTSALNARQRSVNGSRILLLGLAYKKNTGDPREAPSRGIVRRLLALGAEVRAVDPHIDLDHAPSGAAIVDLTEDELRAADLVVLVVDHDAFDLELVGSAAAAVLDCRNVLRGPNVETL